MEWDREDPELISAEDIDHLQQDGVPEPLTPPPPAEELDQTLPPWMSCLESLIAKGQDRVETLLAKQNMRVDVLEVVWKSKPELRPRGH